MELTLDQALQKGVQAHEAGKVQEADQYYTAILNANPKHPDANHNMGVLAVEIDKVEEALPFFKTALEANPSMAQYWISYIDALIKLDQTDEAKAVLDQAKSNWAEGEVFDQLEKKLGSATFKNSKNRALPQEELQGLINLYTQGKYQEALTQALQLLKQFPHDINLFNIVGATNKSLGKLDEAIEAYKKAISIRPDYADAYYNMGVTLQEQGKLEEAIEAYKKALAIKPDYVDAYYNMGATLQEQGKLEEALETYKKALAIRPDFAEAYNNIGLTLNEQSKLEEALEAYNKALALKPNYAEVYYNMGAILREQGKMEDTIEAYNKALACKPDYAEAYYNMGNVLKEQGTLEEALEAYNKALDLKPDFAEAYNNMGVVLKEQGKLEEAIETYNKALAIEPNYAEAHNNMGVALQDQGKLKEAIDAYTKAISLKPDYAQAYWNLSGIAADISESKNWLKKCLEADPNHSKAKLTLTALQFYKGDKSEFNEVLKSSLKDHPFTRSFIWAFGLPKLPTLHFHRWALFDHMTDLSKKDRPFYEFGVWRAAAFRYLIKTFKNGYGFDTFEGIPEDWHNEKAGTYSSDGNVPKIKGGEFIVGKFEDTLPGFFAEPRPMASIINFDADLYSSTICALNFAKPVIDEQTILIFDEFIINDNWEQDEYKALEEFCFNNDYTYQVLAISFFTKQVAVKVIGI